MSPARTTSIVPSSRISRSAPSVSSPAKRPLERLVLADMDREPGARQMRPLLPRAHQRRALARPPQREQPREAAREQRREGLRRDLARRGPPPRGPASCGALARLTPKPTATRSPLRSSRIPPSFLPASIRSLGHLSISGWAAHRRRRSLRSGPGRRPATGSAAADRRAAAGPGCCRRNCPSADTHVRPWRPLPAVCSSATSQSPSTASASASRSALVEPVRSTIRMRRQKMRSRGACRSATAAGRSADSRSGDTATAASRISRPCTGSRMRV